MTDFIGSTYFDLSVAHGNDIRLGCTATLQGALVTQVVVVWIGVGRI